MNIAAVGTSDFMGIVLLIALLISSRIRRSDDKHPEFKIYTLITILTLVACVVDFISFYVDGINKPGMKLVNILTNTLCFVANPIFVSSWCLYEDLKLYRSMTRVKKIYTYAFIPAVIMVLIAIVNMFVPIIFRIDEQNVYSRLPFSYVYYIVDIGYVLFSIFIYKGYERRYGKIRFFPLYLSD